MTTFNTDYSNTELLDQELSFDELQEVNGGIIEVIKQAQTLKKIISFIENPYNIK